MKYRVTAIAGLALATAACATVAAGTSQDIRVVSDPPGADCKLTRDGAHIVSLTTPGTANVPRSKRDLAVTCSKAGLSDASDVIPSVVHAGTVGNIIAGGVVGIVIDAASGANNNYRELTIVVFAPESFETAAARDNFYRDLRRRVTAAADAEVKRVMDSCPQSKREFCTIEADRVKQAKAAALDSVEAKKASARID